MSRIRVTIDLHGMGWLPAMLLRCAYSLLIQAFRKAT